MALTRIQPTAIADVREPNFRNIVINGDQSIAQRSTSTASITSNGYHTIDRFQTVASSLGTWTQSQSTDVPTGQGFATSLKMDCTTADASPGASDQLQIRQKFEGQNLQYLKKGTSSAESTTVSFWIKATKTGTNIVELFDNDNTRQICKSFTISSSDTWEKKTITFAGDTTGAFDNDNNSSLFLVFWLGCGSDFNSGTLSTSWASGSNANKAVGQVNHADSTSNNWYITGVQLEAGSVATDFEVVPYGQNLERCQRYYLRWQGDGSDQRAIGNGMTVENNQSRIVVVYPVTLRGSPTVTEAALETLDSSKDVQAASLNATVDPGINGVNLQMDADSGTPYTQHRPQSLRTSSSTSAFLALDAEL
jgi:hypothetical protein